MVLEFKPETYYDEYHVRVQGLDEDVLKRARESEGLRYREVDGRIIYKGQWLIDWLDRSEAEAGGRRKGVVAR